MHALGRCDAPGELSCRTESTPTSPPASIWRFRWRRKLVNSSADIFSVSIPSASRRWRMAGVPSAVTISRVEPGDDLLWYAGGPGEAEPGGGDQVGITQRLHGRHVGKFRHRPRRRDRERHHRAGTDLADRRTPGHRAHLDVAGDEIGHRLPRALIGDVGEFEVFLARQKLRHQMPDRSRSRRNVVHGRSRSLPRPAIPGMSSRRARDARR